MELIFPSFLEFFNNSFLSDCKIQVEDCQFFAHKIVLAAYTKYFYEYFKTNNEGDLTLPSYIQPTLSKMTIKEIFPHVLKFLYSNISSDSIVEVLDSNTAFMFLSLSQCLDIKKLGEIAENFIILDILGADTAVTVLNEGLLFKNNTIIKASLSILIKNFENLWTSSETREQILKLPFEIILDILSNSGLSVKSENEVYDFICKFIENNKNLSDFHKLELLSKIRWSYLSHSELLKAANNPLIIIAKDLVLEGLSALLAIHEETQYNYRIQTEPRSFYNKSAPLFFKKALSPKNNKSTKTIAEIFPTSQSAEMIENDFVYKHDFDENGVLFYLGTKGKTQKWQNPHSLGEVRAFCSGIGYGKIEDFVGRTPNSLRTTNEEGSYIGVDIGANRLIIPTAYTIKNSNNISHVSLN